MPVVDVEVVWSVLNRIRVVSSGCWEFTGCSRDKKGYGVVKVGGCKGKLLYTHHITHDFFKGVPADGLVRMHLCDNPRCCNPEHLQAGTQKENMEHAKAIGNMSWYKRNPNFKPKD